MIFLDTSVIVAYHNSRDSNHSKALDMIKESQNEQVFISDYIFDECVTLALMRANQKIALGIGDMLLRSDIRMVKVMDMIFQKAWPLFRKNDGVSFTDCATLVILSEFHMKKLLSFDAALVRKFDSSRP